MESRGYDLVDIEKMCYNAGLAFAREMFQYCLSAIEDDIRKNRNQDGDGPYYKNHGGNSTCMKTMMGTVEYHHRHYKYINEKGECKTAYLLDEQLGFNLLGKMTISVAYAAAQLVCEQPYRKVSENLEMLTGLTVSPQGVWNLIQRLAEHLRIDISEIKEELPSEETVRKVASVIFEEADGVYLRMRGKDKPANGHGREMKIATFYEGFKETKRSKNAKRVAYKCVNKKFMTGFEEPDDFFMKKENYLSRVYDINKIKVRLMNSDGAVWIKNMYQHSPGKKHFQLDPYHRNKSLREAGLSKNEIKEVNHYFRHHDIKEAFSVLRRVYQEADNKKKKERILKTYKYLHSNKDGLIPIIERKDLNLPKLPSDLEYRAMGTMESSVGNVVALRMKKRKAAWSKRGAENLSFLIGLKVCGDIKTCIYSLDNAALTTSSQVEDELLDALSAAAIKEVSGSGYEPISSSLPIINATHSFTRKVINELIENRTFDDLPLYRPS
jgi:hypothetical protein